MKKLHPPTFIAHKRDGKIHSEADIHIWISEYTQGDVTDYHMSAWTMAVYHQGMTVDETSALTLAMRDSGQVLDWSNLGKVAIDKHSTGGVGDKVSICLAPIIAACGVAVPMMSGRGLGHTGGTLDKLESIPGFQTSRTIRQFRMQMEKIGCALIGQTQDLAPADKRLYALRDVTATVESIPLITASILSKKLAEGISGLVLDIKVGNGAFMKTKQEATALAKSLVKVGEKSGIEVTAVLTCMDQPLGLTVGNALEVREAFEVLHGKGPKDLKKCTFELGAHMLIMAKAVKTKNEAFAIMERVLTSGQALEKMAHIIRMQKGNPNTLENLDLLPAAPFQYTIQALKSGWVKSMNTKEIGLCSNALGAGRNRLEDTVDSSTGIVLHKKIGDSIEKNEPLATLHLRSKKQIPEIQSRFLKAIEIQKSPTQKPKLILKTIRS